MSYTLLSFNGLPPFNQIKASDIEPALRQLLDEQRAALETILKQAQPTWDNTIAPLEQMQHRLARTWSPVGHLNAVRNSDELRAAYNACLPLLSAWHTDLGQNVKLYNAYVKVNENEGARLNPTQRKLLENAIRDFKLAGVALPAEQKARYKALMEELTQVQAKFDENVLDATNAWSRHVTDAEQLNGLPAPIIERAAAAAAAKQPNDNSGGWLFTLDAPNYMAVLMHGSDENLRREFYQAWVTRASDQGDAKWDNSALIETILRLRHELAQLVGFDNYAAYSLATKMAKSVSEVTEFLGQLATYSKGAAQRELAELTTFAGRELNSWDVSYYAERMKQQRFNLSEEELRPYFPAPQVLSGLFAVASRLYGVQIVERQEVEKYHDDVQFFDIMNADGSRRGSFYVDLYARPKKRGGAWMDDCVSRMQVGQSSYLPVAYLVCNFMPPPAGDDHQPALLTHSEVVTMFHEFGHGLHHMLTRVDYPSVSGINGVPWDAVELPSQFMENFAWQPEVLPLISKHVATGQPLPASELQRLLASRTFQSGMQTVRQLEFALMDLRLHAEYNPAVGSRLATILAEVRAQVAVVTPPAFNRFAHSFSHIFSGGYAAGYYSYKWAEVLAADAFSAFEEQGVFNAPTARRFASAILEQGGSRDAMEAFVEFRGRKPSIEPLLKQLGLAAAA